MKVKYTVDICNGGSTTQLEFNDEKSIKEFEEKVFNCIDNPQRYKSYIVNTASGKKAIFPAKYLNESVILITEQK